MNNIRHRVTKRLRMPDYPEYKLGNYSLRLRPNDSLRMGMAKLGMPDILNFFNASNIEFILRVSVPNNKENRNIKETISYEWTLCTEDDIAVEKKNDPRFNLYNVDGNGAFEFSTAKPKKKRKGEPINYYWLKDRYRISIFKPQAVKIGNFSKLAHYKVLMKFTDSSGINSDYVPMAEFTIHDKDVFRHNILLAIIGVIVIGLGAILFQMCGVTL